MRFGIIGTNTVSHQMMEAASLIEDFLLVAVCSKEFENAKNFAQQYNAKHYTDNYKYFLDKDLDAVYIAAPNNLHKDIAMFFLKHNIPVLCEKPLASNIDEVKSMIIASRKHNTLLAEGILPLYSDSFLVIKDNLDQIGPIRRAIISMGQYSSRYDQFREGNVLNAFKPELSNGSIMDIGIYPLAFAMALFDKPTSVFANAYKLSSNVDGLGTLILNYSDKEVIVMHSKITNQHLQSEIQGEDGSIQFDLVNVPNKVTLIKRNQKPEILYENYDINPMHKQLLKFIEAIKNDQIELDQLNHQRILDIHTVLSHARYQSKVFFPADK